MRWDIYCCQFGRIYLYHWNLEWEWREMNVLFIHSNTHNVSSSILIGSSITFNLLIPYSITSPIHSFTHSFKNSFIPGCVRFIVCVLFGFFSRLDWVMENISWESFMDQTAANVWPLTSSHSPHPYQWKRCSHCLALNLSSNFNVILSQFSLCFLWISLWILPQISGKLVMGIIYKIIIFWGVTDLLSFWWWIE